MALSPVNFIQEEKVDGTLEKRLVSVKDYPRVEREKDMARSI